MGEVVEVFDVGSTEWRSGPTLPFPIGRSEMVEDPLGGVILIGGQNSAGKVDSKIFMSCFTKKKLFVPGGPFGPDDNEKESIQKTISLRTYRNKIC